MNRRTASKKRPSDDSARAGRSGRQAGARLSRSAQGGGALPARLRPRKHPRQERAQETLAAILQAATELLATSGYAATTTNKIAARAGVSIGSLYQYFPNKDAILAALTQRHLSAVKEVIDRSMLDLENKSIPIETGFRNLLTRLFELHEADPLLARALGDEAAHHTHPPHGGHQGYVDRVEAILRRRPDVRRGDHALMAHLVGQTAGTLTRWFVHEAPPGLHRQAAIDEIVRLLTRYVRD